MCRPLLFIVLQVLMLEYVTSYSYNDYILAYIPVEELAYLSSENMETIPYQPFPYYGSGLFYSPGYQSMMMQAARSPFMQATGPVSFGGQVKAKGAVSITGSFGNQGCRSFTSYSAPSTPLIVASQPVLPTTTSFLTDYSSLATSTTLPVISTLPAVTLPSATINQPFIDTMPSTVCVPTMPMPFIVVTTTVANDNIDWNGNVAKPIKFSGLVPASGRVKISTHFGC